MSDTPPKHFVMDDQVLPNDLLINIFTKTEPKTMARCRSLNKFWMNYLSPYNVSKEVTFVNDDKHACVFLHVGLPPWISSSDTLLSVDIDSGLAKLCELPFEVNSFGWWNVIASQYGLLCIRYTNRGFLTKIIVWNSLNNLVRFLTDPATQQCCQAIFGYAFGCVPNNDRFFVVYVSKEHTTDDFLSYDIYDSAHGQWAQGRSSLVTIHKLGYHSVIYQGRAYWIDWSGPEYRVANSIVSFHIHEKKFNTMLLPKKSRGKLNYLINYNGTLCFASHQIRLSGVTVVFWKVEMEDQRIVEWKRFTGLCNLGNQWNPIILSGHDLIRVNENHADDDNGEPIKKYRFSISKFNTKQGSSETYFYTSPIEQVVIKSSTKVVQGLLNP